MTHYQLNVCNIEKTVSIESAVSKRVEKLRSVYDTIEQCNIAISMENRSAHSGKIFTLRLSVRIPGKKPFNVKKQDENIYTAIHAAFHAIERMIDKHEHKQDKQFKLAQCDYEQLINAFF
jgi:ribosomal subunit interface protein